ncbi:Hypothetical_protein [Hexamita inflata]|uniref:Hypothetical_protein n=1 Tax=Hexamita inflata TaxID=28002 RepID=A0AA86RBR3_9EUKA|nr:Hypothetical protein HINF_LOCUS48451 [Hexamita inflata]CAI9973282.1 Hypothetical protein HINF_LOCUS60927 [Hexamita inflata]
MARRAAAFHPKTDQIELERLRAENARLRRSYEGQEVQKLHNIIEKLQMQTDNAEKDRRDEAEIQQFKKRVRELEAQLELNQNHSQRMVSQLQDSLKFQQETISKLEERISKMNAKLLETELPSEPRNRKREETKKQVSPRESM